MEKQPLREFFDALNREETVIREWIAEDAFGLRMRLAINELDLELEGALRTGRETGADEERAYLMRLGVNRLVKLALDAHPSFAAPTWTLQRDGKAAAAIASRILDLGRIDHGRRIAQSLVAAGGRVEMARGRFRIVLPEDVVDREVHERDLDRHYYERRREEFESGPQAFVEDQIGDDVRRLLKELVYPAAGWCIGYESDPVLDVYFYGRGWNEIELAKGFDTFHFNTRFGGMRFQDYKLACAYIVQAAHRHRAFALALLEKAPGVRLEDILTVSGETWQFLESMRDFINFWGEGRDGHEPVDDDGVRVLFDVLSVSRRNRKLLDRPGAAIPALIQCSTRHVVKVLSGANGRELMQFLLNSLQHSFEKDYARAQREHEGVMQRGIEKMLKAAMPSLDFRSSIKLRQRGRELTDIDLVAIDPATGRILLFQLKHQDHYGEDIAAMLTRTERLDRQVGEWAAKVRGWLSAAGELELRATLRLRSGQKVSRVSLVAVTRHFAHSLRALASEAEIAFGNWAQLATVAFEMEQAGGGSLDDLIARLNRLTGAEPITHLPESPSVWRVGSLCFSVEPAARDSGAVVAADRG